MSSHHESRSRHDERRALVYAIDDIDTPRLRRLLKRCCSSDDYVSEALSSSLFINGKHVRRYCIDCVEGEQSEQRDRWLRNHEHGGEIRAEDSELTPKYTSCDRCDEVFNLEDNSGCIWHSGKGILRVDLSDDATTNAHYLSTIHWDCCDGEHDSEGCRITMHRTDMNIVLEECAWRISEAHANSRRNVEIVVPVMSMSRKRGADEIVPRERKKLNPTYKICENCEEEFDIDDNEEGKCASEADHPGYKEVDYDSDFWCNHDERCHGRMESFEDDPDYADGFMWSCCRGEMDSVGWAREVHVAVESEEEEDEEGDSD